MRLLALMFVFSFVSTFGYADTSKPETYVSPRGGIALTADKAPAGELHRARAVGVRLLPQDKNALVGGIAGGEVIRWDIEKRAIVWRKKVFEKGLGDIEVSPDGKFIFCTSGVMGLLNVVKSADGEPVASEPVGLPGVRLPLLGARKAQVVGVVHGNMGTELTWLSYGSGEAFEFGDRGTAMVAESFISFEGALSWDGTRIAIGNTYSDGQKINKHTLDVFDTKTGKAVVSMTRDEEYTRLAFSPEGDRIVSWGGARDTRLLLNDLTKKEILRVLDPDLRYVGVNRFSPDGKYLYTQADMRVIERGKPVPYVRMYEVDTGKFLSVIAPAVLPTNPRGRMGPSDLDISADGKRFAMSLSDNSLVGETLGNLPDFVVWDMP